MPGQFSEAALSGALMKKKKQHAGQISKDKKWYNYCNYNKSKGGSVRLRAKIPFKAKRKLINIMLPPQVQRERVPDLGSAEPEGALVLSCPS